MAFPLSPVRTVCARLPRFGVRFLAFELKFHFLKYAWAQVFGVMLMNLFQLCHDWQHGCFLGHRKYGYEKQKRSRDHYEPDRNRAPEIAPPHAATRYFRRVSVRRPPQLFEGKQRVFHGNAGTLLPAFTLSLLNDIREAGSVISRSMQMVQQERFKMVMASKEYSNPTFLLNETIRYYRACGFFIPETNSDSTERTATDSRSAEVGNARFSFEPRPAETNAMRADFTETSKATRHGLLRRSSCDFNLELVDYVSSRSEKATLNTVSTTWFAQETEAPPPPRSARPQAVIRTAIFRSRAATA
jgi:hypothetical protein